ncbi:uroporphyrinogen decarboxylase family protein [Treponema primitia]|uniref:uroporphyrinogen decarboxylase family protein n=1 Tax=Treponema primitia TaxID=88058 RepID=UPI000255512A|nr:uroporphyrinogen decarboxylase family protein [Treponema primitia]
MLSIRQNFLETIHGGKPDRFVNQYEFIDILFGLDPISRNNPSPTAPGQETKNSWGVTVAWREGQPGAFPVHDAEHKVVKDIRKWKEVVKTTPRLEFPEADWADAIKAAQAVDRKEKYCAAPYFTGVFEMLHYLMGVDECLIDLYEEPELIHELVDFITEYELKYAEQWCKYVKPDALFHHDDWGTQISSFMSPDMFREFFLPSYKKIYSYWKSHGVEIIVHHSDSYAANLVPQMIEMGIDVWQGCTTQNDVPALVKQYGPKISFMGDINNGVLDKADWTPAEVRRDVERTCRENGKLYFIPCMVHGLGFSIFPGVYEEVSKEIDRMSKEMF